MKKINICLGLLSPGLLSCLQKIDITPNAETSLVWSSLKWGSGVVDALIYSPYDHGDKLYTEPPNASSFCPLSM